MQAYTPMTLMYDPAGQIKQNADDVAPGIGVYRKDKQVLRVKQQKSHAA